MQIKYTEGPDHITMGQAGSFERGVAKTVDKDLAERLLSKKSINFQRVEQTGDKKNKEA